MRTLTASTFAALALSLAACSSATPTAAPTVTVTAPAPTVTVPGPASTTVTAPAKTVTVTAPPAAPVAAIDEGVWTVGADIAAGRYRTTAAVAEGCYWSITKSGSNGGDIVDNGLPTGGRPTVTLRAGQDFETKACGSWAKL